MKGQITLFMILGIILLMVFGFLFYVSKYTVELQSEENIHQQGAVDIDLKKVKFFVQSCLDQATDDALTLSAMQGGFIYDYQVEGGYGYKGIGRIYPPPMYERDAIPYYDTYTGKSYNVTYAIRPRDKANARAVLPPFTRVHVPIIEKEIDYPWIFGEPGDMRANLPALCNRYGVNIENISGSEYSCPVYYGHNTIQDYMVLYIKEKSIECLESKGFKDNFDYNVDYDNVTVQVLFGEEDVHAKLNLHASLDANGTTNELEEFTTTVNVRYKQMYEYLMTIFQKEGESLFFDLRNDINSVSGCKNFVGNARNTLVNCHRDGFNIKLVQRACEQTADSFGGIQLCETEGKKSSFIVLEDNHSTSIDNRPFTMVVAIGNRGPYMEKISFDAFDGDKSSLYCQYLNDTYGTYFTSNYLFEPWPWKLYNRTRSPVLPASASDIIIDHDKVLFIIPWALDPDEDYLDDKIIPVMKKTDDPLGVIYEYHSDSPAWDTKLMNSNTFTTGIGGSYRYKDVSYQLNESDVGTHKVTVTVKDATNHTFSRDVKVQVRCFDRKRFHPVGTSETRNMTGRWVDGIFQSGNVNVLGDYNFSNPTQPDINDSNDCCNETAGYIFNGVGHICDICHRCDGNGNCVVNATAGNDDTGNSGNPFGFTDCPPCQRCDNNGKCVPDSGNSRSCNETGLIPSSLYPGSGMCCVGNCVDTTNPTNISLMTGWGMQDSANATKYFINNRTCWNTSINICITEEYAGDSGSGPVYPHLVGYYTNPPKNFNDPSDPGYVLNGCGSSSCVWGKCQ